MGNGQTTNGGYGILIFGTDPTDKLQPDTWYHVAVTVEGSSSYPYTPVRASLYLDGDLIGSKVNLTSNCEKTNRKCSYGTKEQVESLLELLVLETSQLKKLL